MSFKNHVLKVVSQIPKGEILTYKQVAIHVGSPKAYQVVGNILNKNYNPKIPCHRIICSNGEASGYNRGVALKKKKLKHEGV